MKLVVIKLYDL